MSARFLVKFGRPRQRLDFALPTINVIFLLMLYFLVAGTLAERDELSVLPPTTTPLPAERLPRPLLLVTDDGRLVLDGIPVVPADIGDRAPVALEAARASELNLLVPAAMPAEPFLALLARLDAAGVPVRLVTVERPGVGNRP